MSSSFMESSSYLFTSESVTEGHPDKICDQISDGVLDAMLTLDPRARVACEVSCTTGLVVVMGEISISSGYVDIPALVRETIRDIGYTDPSFGFDFKSCGVMVAIDEQSSDISAGVSTALEARKGNITEDEVESLGAGDQGMMVGFACDETPELMPLPMALSHKLTQKLAEVRKNGKLPYLRPDGKSQVTIEYSNGTPKRVHTVLLSNQHSEEVDNETITKDLINEVAKVSYAIGVSAPISVSVETFGTNNIPNEEIDRLVKTHFDLRPGAIIKDLDLRRPIYKQTAAYGHFGRDDLQLPWENIDRSEAIRKDAGI